MYVPTWIKVVWAWNWFHFNKVDKTVTPKFQKFQISFPKKITGNYMMPLCKDHWHPGKKQAIQNGGSLLP